MHRVELKIPSDPQFLQAVRLTTASLANKVGFDVDDVDDLKVIISEIVTYAIPINEEILIKFDLFEDKIKMTIELEKLSYDFDKYENEAILKKQILLSLADEIEIDEAKAVIVKYK